MIGRRIRAVLKADINPLSMTRRVLKLIEADRLDEAYDFLVDEERRSCKSQSMQDQRRYQRSRLYRGFLLMRQRKWAEAEQLFSEIIDEAKAPPSADLWAGRAKCRLKLGKTDEAKSDLRMAITAEQSRETGGTLLLDSRKSIEFRMGLLAEDLGLWSDAVWTFERMLIDFPGDAFSHNQLAWLRAGAPDPEVRDGKLAVQHALLIQEDGWAKWGLLAAAYAECGDFDEAIRWAETSLEHAPEEEKPARMERLAQYKRGEPFRIEVLSRSQTGDGRTS